MEKQPQSDFWQKLRQQGCRVFPVGRGPVYCAGFGDLHRATVFCPDGPGGPGPGVLMRLALDLGDCCPALGSLSVARGLEDQGALVLPFLPGGAEGDRVVRRLCRSFSARKLVRLHRGEKGLCWLGNSPKGIILGQLLCSASGFPPVLSPEPPSGPEGCVRWFARCFGRPAYEIGLGPEDGAGAEAAIYARLLETLLIALLV